jgi:hypothetical protein
MAHARWYWYVVAGTYHYQLDRYIQYTHLHSPPAVRGRRSHVAAVYKNKSTLRSLLGYTVQYKTGHDNNSVCDIGGRNLLRRLMKAFAPNSDESPDQRHQGLFEGEMVLNLVAQKSVCANGKN